MSIIKTGDTYLQAYSNSIRQHYYISSYYTLTGDNVYIQYDNPINLNFNKFAVKNYLTNFGDNQTVYQSTSSEAVYHNYNVQGTYYVKFSAVYTDNSVQAYTIPYPITVKSYWDIYNQNDIRLNDEIILQLPYTLEDVYIQPNEWGVEDIFNTSVNRVQDCIDYLIAKTQTINTYTPTLFFGWLGNNTGSASSTIKWFTKSYNSEYYKNPELSKSQGASYFTNILDIAEIDDYLYVIDDTKLRIFINKAIPEEIEFKNGDQLNAFLINPISFDINDTGDTIYIADQTANNIYKLNISINTTTLSASDINIQIFTGGFGGLNDNNSFNTPLQVYTTNNNVYVLDYNNYCVKQYNQDLNWLYTYYVSNFNNDRPISIAALSNGLLYILTENYNIYIFDNASNEIFEIISVANTDDGSILNKISFDYNEDFFFVLTEQNVYKYTLAGSFVSKFILPKTKEVIFNNIKRGQNGIINLSTKNSILKCQDILQVYKLGNGLPYNIWSRDQIKVSKNEFTSNLVYNRSLTRLAQNIKTFRDNLNAKFIIATENARNNIVTYFSFLPISVQFEQPKLHPDVDSNPEKVSVGVNELHLPPVLNREIEKLYTSLEILSDFLSIKNYTVSNKDCVESFCWSWNATSCYNLSLPVIKTCNVNPISYKELELSQLGTIEYAPVPNNFPFITWENAVSKCCEKK